MKLIKKVFGGIELTWPKLIVFAVLAGVYTAVMAIIPALHYTSFHTIVVTFEVWILFGIVIIMNSKSNLDAALKCFVFFLISQPLVYLIQVPFSRLGWALFGYYRTWFIWTLLCFPMGFIGYYIKKGKWWGYLILFPMIALTGYSYLMYFSYFTFYAPKFILICLFCAAMMLLYPIALFEDKMIRAVGLIISGVIIVAVTVVGILNPYVYHTQFMSNSEEHPIDDTYRVYLEDERYGDAGILYVDSIEDYMVYADLKKAGKTALIVESPTGERTVYDLTIEIDTYDCVKREN